MSIASKYASLPDIDSAPDVYETPDVPPLTSGDRDSDSDSDLPRVGSPTTSRRGLAAQGGGSPSENIDVDRLDTGEARRRFGAARLGGGQQDLSRGSSRRLPSTRTYAIAEPGEKETHLERLRRLRLEVEQLEEDVKREQAESTTTETGNETTTTTTTGEKKRGEVTPGVILQQLQLLRGDLGGLGLGSSDEGVLEGEGEKEEKSVLADKAKASSSLLSKLGFGAATTDSTTAGAATVTPPSPTKAKKETFGGDAQLEKRLAEVERALGASEADVDEAHPLPPPLLSTVTRLDHLLTLLTQPRHLDSISRRVKVLVSDLERLHDSRRKLGDTRPLNVALSGGMTVAVPGGEGKGIPSSSAPQTSTNLAASTLRGGEASLPPDALQKIDALFTLLPRLDPLLPLTPRLLTRLRSLSTLHSSAATFGETLRGLQDEIGKLGESEKGLKEVLEGLEKSVGENDERLRGNLQGLEGRVGEVVRRLDQLGV